MLEKLSEALNAVKSLPTQLLVVVAIAVGFILFVPQSWAASLALDKFRDEYRVFLGPTLVLVSAWLLARAIGAAVEPIRERNNLRKLAKQLEDLTPEEQGYLLAFMEGATTINVSMEDGIAGGLKAQRIIYRSSNVFNALEGVPYNLQPWARDHLTLHPELLANAQGRPVSPRQRMGQRW